MRDAQLEKHIPERKKNTLRKNRCLFFNSMHKCSANIRCYTEIWRLALEYFISDRKNKWYSFEIGWRGALPDSSGRVTQQGPRQCLFGILMPAAITINSSCNPTIQE
jgi:hypothetical protein